MLFFRSARITILDAIFFRLPLLLILSTCSMSAAQQPSVSSASPQTHQRVVERGQIDLGMGKDTAAAEHATFSVVP